MPRKDETQLLFRLSHTSECKIQIGVAFAGVKNLMGSMSQSVSVGRSWETFKERSLFEKGLSS